MEKHDAAQLLKDRGQSGGPPFAVSSADLPYVGYAIYQVGDQFNADNRRQFAARLYNKLYLEWFAVEHPEACDAKVSKLVRDTGARLENR